jgi:hypothetical protein
VRCSGRAEHRTPNTNTEAVTLVLVALEQSETAEIFAELIEELGLPVAEGAKSDEPDSTKPRPAPAEHPNMPTPHTQATEARMSDADPRIEASNVKMSPTET